MNDYTKQAEDFLQATGTTFTVIYQYTGPYFQGDKEKRDVFRFTLKNAKGEYSSTFGDSIRNTEDRAKRAKGYKKPSAYDILACLEKYEPDTFENWCRECGYDEQPLSEYPKVLKVWTDCVEQFRGLRKIFSEEQMEQLREIS